MRRAEEQWCLALNVLSQRSAQLRRNPETITHIHTDAHIYADTYTHCVLVNCSIHLLKNTGICITPRSWKQTLWILKDFDAFIKDRLCFEFIWIVLYDVYKTFNMSWMLMARWAVCVISDETSLNGCVVLGWLVGAVSLWIFTVLWKLAKTWQVSTASKASSLSTLCSLQPLNLRKKWRRIRDRSDIGEQRKLI